MNVRGLATGIVVLVVVLIAALASTMTMAWAQPAAGTPSVAPGGRVTVLQSSSLSPRARRCLTRLREELTAGGFDVTVAEFGAGGEALWMVDPPAPGDGSIATVTLVGNPDEGEAELWIVDGVPGGRVVVRRLLVPAGPETHEDEVVAVRTLEFLRATAFELARRMPPSAPMPGASAPAPLTVAAGPASFNSPGPTRGPVSVELGLSLLESSSALGPAFLPVVRLRAEWLSLLETRITAAGFGTEPRVTTSQGTAAVGQMLGLLELRAAFRHGHALRPAIGVGGGFLRVNVEGTPSARSYQGFQGERWSALFDVGAGLTARLFRGLSLAVEAHGQLAAPYPTVRFAGEEVARLGRPALFSSLSLVAPL